MAANIGDICSRTFQLRNNNIRQRNHRTEKISAESSLKQWKVNYVLSSPVNNSLLYIFRRLSGTQNKGGYIGKYQRKKDHINVLELRAANHTISVSLTCTQLQKQFT